jgi:hypothetical protein
MSRSLTIQPSGDSTVKAENKTIILHLLFHQAHGSGVAVGADAHR